ncbi:hypothetical protein GCM10027605_68480 [Micromonospora zhanjiangensis]
MTGPAKPRDTRCLTCHLLGGRKHARCGGWAKDGPCTCKPCWPPGTSPPPRPVLPFTKGWRPTR